VTEYELHTGASFPPPVVDKWRPPPGEITWADEDVASVSTSGPALTVSIDFKQPRAKGMNQVVVVRLRDVRGYFPTTYPDYTDPNENLAVSATVTMPPNGVAENVVLVIPYVTMPRDSGGITEVEIAIHDPGGLLTAIDFRQIELPEDFDRVPDMLTVVAHALVALAQVDGKLTRDHVRIMRSLMHGNFHLDDLGDEALRRILKIASATHHSPQTLSEVVLHSVPEENRSRLVNLLYAAAEAEGREITKAQQAFVAELLERCKIHDHKRYGPEKLMPAYNELELAPGVDLDTVKKAWRTLVRDYHPDRVQNLAKGFKDFAHDKTSRLNKAYDTLRRALGDPDAKAVVEVDD